MQEEFHVVTLQRLHHMNIKDGGNDWKFEMQ
jgi:hypothetical protein